MENKYNVVFTGNLRPGANTADVIANFASVFKVPEDQAQKIILAGQEKTLKKDVPLEVANQYKAKLQQIGLDVILRPVLMNSSADEAPRYQDTAQETVSPVQSRHIYPAQDPAAYNPYQSPKSDLNQPSSIDELVVSEKWKERFRLIEEAGGPRLPQYKNLSFSERMKITSNILSFLFWVIYLPIKGMWRLAITYFILCVVLGIVLDIAGFPTASRAIGYGMSALVMYRTNTSYYRYKVLGEKPWF